MKRTELAVIALLLVASACGSIDLNDQERAALENSVARYVAAFNQTDMDQAVSMISRRCTRSVAR
jgi:hypothetical protein